MIIMVEGQPYRLLSLQIIKILHNFDNCKDYYNWLVDSMPKQFLWNKSYMRKIIDAIILDALKMFVFASLHQ